ncbi:MAG: MATE family efflux transporter [Lentisphaeria bacterium]|nr:MATE family efflux transporter [Lentisphaeria bacterium]
MSKYQMDMCHGNLARQVLVFAVPLVFSGLLQVLFHSADLMVVGRFASHHALAAVGATAALTWLMINIFIGMSVATNVITARCLGEKNRKNTSKVVHTSIAVSLAGGAFLAFIGICFSRFFLKLMDTPDEVIDMSTLYMQIYFAGMPVVMLYNFGSAVLRAAGDTKRPFYFLIISGIVNIILNLFFVICCGMDVGGVALATVISQAIAAGLILKVLTKMHGGCRFYWKKLHIYGESLKEIIRIGVPAGFQGACFSISSMLIQSSINSFGSEAIAGNTAAGQWEGFFFVAFGAFSQTAVSFAGQNLGGRQYKRIVESVKYCVYYCTAFAIAGTLLIWIFNYETLTFFNKNPEVIRWGILRYKVFMPLVFFGGLMEIFVGAMRGLGYSLGPTIVMIFGACIFRIVWVVTIFKYFHSMAVLILSYPVSWILISVIMIFYFRKAMQKYQNANNFCFF